jgi:hypothetical protein
MRGAVRERDRDRRPVRRRLALVVELELGEDPLPPVRRFGRDVHRDRDGALLAVEEHPEEAHRRHADDSPVVDAERDQPPADRVAVEPPLELRVVDVRAADSVHELEETLPPLGLIELDFEGTACGAAIRRCGLRPRVGLQRPVDRIVVDGMVVSTHLEDVPSAALKARRA